MRPNNVTHVPHHGTWHGTRVLLINLKISEWLGSISVTCVLETTLADHKWTDRRVKSDVLTPIQGSSSVVNDYKKRQGGLYALHGGGERKLSGTKRQGRDEKAGAG